MDRKTLKVGLVQERWRPNREEHQEYLTTGQQFPLTKFSVGKGCQPKVFRKHA